MRGYLLVAAAAVAATLSAAPAAAQSADAGYSRSSIAPGQFTRSNGVRIHRGSDGVTGSPDFRDGERRDGRRFRGDTFLPYRDYQGDSLWRSDSFNDWWHDRPDRAFPRWVANNQDCQRRYWAGGGWRC